MEKITRQLTYVLCLFIVAQSCTEPQVKTKPRLENMTVSVYASLIVQPEDLVELYAEVSGVVQSVQIEEGDTVQKNQVLATIKRDNISFDVNSAKISQELAEQNLRGQSTKLITVSSELKNLQNQHRLDSLNYMRQKKLWNQNIGSKNQLEVYQLRYEQSLENLSALTHSYNQLKQELEASYLLSENNVKKLRSVSANYSIRSFSHGRIYSLNKDVGESITSQEPFVQIGSGSEFVINMQIDEVDIVNLKLGQDVAISLDAYPKQVFRGTITKILPSKNLRTQTFTVEAKFTEPSPSLYAGLAGEASIIVSRKKAVMTIPLEYIVGNDQVLDDEGNFLKVVFGNKNMDRVEILSGIDTSTVIVKQKNL